MISTTLSKKFQQAAAAQAQLNAITNDAEMCQNVQRVAELVAAMICRLASANGESLDNRPVSVKRMFWNISIPLNGDTSNPLIDITWLHYWPRTGGEEKGTFSFPMSYILDDSALLEYLRECEVAIREIENKREEERIRLKVEEYNRLQKEIVDARRAKSLTTSTTNLSVASEPKQLAPKNS